MSLIHRVSVRKYYGNSTR